MKKDFDTAIKVAGKVVDHWLPLKIQYDHTPGVVVCIAVNGVPKYTKAFGYSDIENKVVMKNDAQFRVASMSKMFTAVSILQLQENDKLRLDDTVVSYLPWFKGKQGKIDLSNVTIRQLLSHNAGLFRDGTAKQWITDNFPTELSKTISAKSIVFENGTTLKYSNHGYAVLGAVIEAVSGISYVEFVTEHIIKKLNLKNTLPDLPEKRSAKLAYGYSRYLPDQPTQVKEPDSITNTYAPATGFISNVKDLAAFLASLHLDSKKSVLSRESKKVMMQVHGITDNEGMYGLGLALEKESGQLTYGHSGGFAGYTTNAISEPENNVQVIVLTNTISNTAWTVSNNLMRLIFKLKAMKEVIYQENEPYSGTYRCRWGDLTVVSLGKNLVDFGAGAQNPVKAWSTMESEQKNVFRNTDKSGFGSPGELVRFSKFKDGRAQEMSNDGMTWIRLC
ncbi:MAG: class A beta-lactamase-related serine hydrolase [Burkholderiaceae bacterium]|jgi:CubicO group peptidase (beta-lactamase class C family)|nr:MAG: class A beta-lactamase-related serine hydrolase [Burkholderiaceae bacterium]